MDKIDNDGYDEGYRLFCQGGSLRSIVERSIALEDAYCLDQSADRTREYTKKEQALHSVALGFADALLYHLRNLPARV